MRGSTVCPRNLHVIVVEEQLRQIQPDVICELAIMCEQSPVPFKIHLLWKQRNLHTACDYSLPEEFRIQVCSRS